jgi:hypothetical protein
MTEGVRNMIREIRAHCGTWCVPNGNGATNPWDMHRANLFLADRTSLRVDAQYNGVGVAEDRLMAIARDAIKLDDTPAVIGTGWLEHYPLAWGYKLRSKVEWWGTVHERKFYVNQGWGGAGDGWINASTWFAGTIVQ